MQKWRKSKLERCLNWRCASSQLQLVRRVLPQERLLRHPSSEEARSTKQAIYFGHPAFDVRPVPAKAVERRLPGKGEWSVSGGAQPDYRLAR